MKNFLAAIMFSGIISFFNPAAANTCYSTNCSELGYSQNDIPECLAYIYCPFDTSYKACAKYASKLDACPEGAICEESFKINNCIDGYSFNSQLNTCQPNPQETLSCADALLQKGYLLVDTAEQFIAALAQHKTIIITRDIDISSSSANIVISNDIYDLASVAKLISHGHNDFPEECINESANEATLTLNKTGALKIEGSNSGNLVIGADIVSANPDLWISGGVDLLRSASFEATTLHDVSLSINHADCALSAYTNGIFNLGRTTFTGSGDEDNPTPQNSFDIAYGAELIFNKTAYDGGLQIQLMTPDCCITYEHENNYKVCAKNDSVVIFTNETPYLAPTACSTEDGGIDNPNGTNCEGEIVATCLNGTSPRQNADPICAMK